MDQDQHPHAPPHQNHHESSHNCDIIDKLLTKVLEKQSNAHHSYKQHSHTSDIRRTAALEAKVYQFETEAIAAVAARRRAEQDASSLRSELSSLAKSTASKQADHEQAMDFCRAQLTAKTQEIERLDGSHKKISAELAKVKAEAQEYKDEIAAKERVLKEKAAAAEQRAEELASRLHIAENRERISGAEKQALLQNQSITERECAALKEQLIKSKEDVDMLKNELMAAKTQLESIFATENKGIVAEEGLREALAQRAALTQECRGLRCDVGRLQNALNEEKSAFEREKHQHEQHLSAAHRQIESLKSSLEAKKEAINIAESQIAALRADAERERDAQHVTVASLKEKLRDAKRVAEETKKRAEEETEAEVLRTEERFKTALQTALMKQQQRIQDLEMQLLHSSNGDNRGAFHSGIVSDSPTDQHKKMTAPPCSVPGGFLSSVLEYIPRSEHIRLLEIRTAEKEEEMRCRVDQAKRTLLGESRIMKEELTAELHRMKAQLCSATEDAAMHKAEAQRSTAEVQRYKAEGQHAEHALTTMCSECADLERRLDAARDEARSMRAQREEQAAVLTAERRRSDKMHAANEKALEEHRGALQEMNSLKRQFAVLQEALIHAKEETNDLNNALDLAKKNIDIHLREKNETRDELNELQGQLSTTKELMCELEKCLGLTAANSEFRQTQAPSCLHARASIILSRCRELQTEAQQLSLKNAALERQYNADMAALEQTARQQVASMKSQANEAIAHVRRASTSLQEKLSTRASTLAEELADLKLRIAEQKEEAERVENREKEMAAMIDRMVNGGGLSADTTSTNNKNNNNDIGDIVEM